MKFKTTLVILFLLVANTTSAQSIFDKWPELKSLHEVLSQTFHPTEEGNFEPIKTRSEELMVKSQSILKSNIPEEFRTKTILSFLEELQFKAEQLNKSVVAKASNEQLLQSITGVHDSFHKIVGLCTNEKY